MKLLVILHYIVYNAIYIFSKRFAMEKENKELGISLNKKTMAAITLVLVAVLAFIGVLTQILPRGEYQVAIEDGHQVIVNGTYSLLEDYKMPIWKIVLSPILCLASSQATTGLSIILIIVLVIGWDQMLVEFQHEIVCCPDQLVVALVFEAESQCWHEFLYLPVLLFPDQDVGIAHLAQLRLREELFHVDAF